MTGPGTPEFQARMRAHWIEQMRALVPDLSDERFDQLIHDFDKIRDEFIEALNRDR